MKISNLLFSFGLLILGLATQAQVGIGTNTPAASAQLEVNSTTKGFLPPRMLASERAAIGSPAAGLMVYQTDGTKGLYYYDGSSWIFIIQTNITGNAGTATNLTGLTTSVSTLNNVSGSNSGDETAATIKTKLGVTTLSGSNTGDQDLSSFATSTALNNKVDKVSGKDLSTNDYSSTEKAKLAGITGTNTGDQDLTGKVDKVTGKGLSTNDYTSTEQTKLAAITGTNSGDETAAGIKTKLGVTTLSGSNTGDQDLSSYATSSALGNKVDKVTGKDLSTNDYTTTEKTKLAAITGSNTGDQTTITGNAGSATNLAAGVAGAVPYQTAANTTGFTAAGSNGQVLTVAGGVPTWAAAASSGVPYTGASSAVDLGAYDLTVNGVKIGKGLGNVASNTAVGNSALSANTTGSNNTSMGIQSMTTNTTGSYNSAYGPSSLARNTTGSQNIAIGRSALGFNTTGSRNTAVGDISASNKFGNISTGDRNSAFGIEALAQNESGSNNTALGASADVSVGNLTNATALGYGALVTASNTIQLGNTNITNTKTSGTITAGTVTYPNAHNSTAGQVLTTDAAGVASWATVSGGVPYTGANQAVDLGAYDLTVNGVKVGKGLGNVATNTAVGNSALSSNTTGGNNTSMGYQSLKNNTIGDYNISIGNYSLLTNTTGLYNTAIGHAANVAANNLTNATAIGYQASAPASNSIQLGNTLVENVKTSGSLTSGTVTYPNAHNSTAGQVLTVNAAGRASWAASSAFPSKVEGTGFSGSLLVGHQTTGTLGSGAAFNTGVGIGAMQAISANGTGNTGTGYQALTSATSGQFNTATGLRALKSITTAMENTAFGSQSLELNTGGQNTAIGTLSLNTNTTGTRNTAIGTYADVSAANLTNATAIGYNAKVATDNTIQLGNTFVTAVNTSGALVGGNTATSTISGFGANMNAQTGTTYTLSAADNGKIITLNNSAAITLTVPALFAGFNCMIVQLGAGAVTLTASGTTISNRSSLTKTAGANAIVTLIALSANSYISAGDMQ
jgi:hypothetical protein